VELGENQVMAAIKSVRRPRPMAQKILLALGSRLEELATRAAAMERQDLCNFTPGWPSSRRAREAVTRGFSGHDVARPRRAVGSRQNRPGRFCFGARCANATIAVVTNDIYTEEDAQFLVRNGVGARAHHRVETRRLPAHRDPRGRLDQPRSRGAP